MEADEGLSSTPGALKPEGLEGSSSLSLPLSWSLMMVKLLLLPLLPVLLELLLRASALHVALALLPPAVPASAGLPGPEEPLVAARSTLPRRSASPPVISRAPLNRRAACSLGRAASACSTSQGTSELLPPATSAVLGGCHHSGLTSFGRRVPGRCTGRPGGGRGLGALLGALALEALCCWGVQAVGALAGRCTKGPAGQQRQSQRRTECRVVLLYEKAPLCISRLRN